MLSLSIALIVFIAAGFGGRWLLLRLPRTRDPRQAGLAYLGSLRWRDFTRLVVQAMKARGYALVQDPRGPADGVDADVEDAEPAPPRDEPVRELVDEHREQHGDEAREPPPGAPDVAVLEGVRDEPEERQRERVEPDVDPRDAEGGEVPGRDRRGRGGRRGVGGVSRRRTCPRSRPRASS